MLALQGFQVEGLQTEEIHPPTRRDGGAWLALGWSFPAGFDFAKVEEIKEYSHAGHRDSGGECDFHGAKYLRLCEFDTSLWDSPSRFAACGGYENYFGGALRLLWSVFKGEAPEEREVCDALLKSIPGFIKMGLLADPDGNLTVDIPVVRIEEYDKIRALTAEAKTQLIKEAGTDYRTLTEKASIRLPSHLKSVAEFFRYLPATGCITMSVICEAYKKGLHLSDVDYCCPPAVLVYDE